MKNAIVIALRKRHSGGVRAHKDRRDRRGKAKNAWRKEAW